MEMTVVGIVGIMMLGLSGSWLSLKSQMGRIERKLNALLKERGIVPGQEFPLSDRVKQLADDPSRQIEAIRVYREEMGVGLAEGKEAIDAYTHSK